jgi:RNA polymerase sigma-70 factor, ECF subfamily
MQVVEITTADSPLTDNEVISRVLGGERHLFEILMRRNNQRVFRAARAIVKNDEEAQDVMQESYVRAYQHLSEFRGEAQLSTWLCRIAVHEALARVRRAGKMEPTDPEMMEGPNMPHSTSRDPEEATSDDELRVMLEEAVDSLPEVFRTVFVLRAVEQMSTLEVAEALSVPEDTVKTRLFRARGLLRQALLAKLEDAETTAFQFLRPRCDRVVANVLARIIQH